MAQADEDSSAADRRVLLRAAWVAPMDRPPIANGAVLIDDGRIAAVGPFRDVWPARPCSPARRR